MKRLFYLFGAILSLTFSIGYGQTRSVADQPNVLIILADDMGFGDVGAFGAELISTPSIDRLAHEGIRFTRAYTPCSVCSPTRYGLMTGRYAWRSRQHPETKVLQDGQALAIEKGRETLATLFKKKGYATAVIGKWHLGFGEFSSFNDNFDWTKGEIAPGPLEVGFDYYFGLAANVSNHPRFFIENHDFFGRKRGDNVTVRAPETNWDGEAKSSDEAFDRLMLPRGDVIPWDPAVIWRNEEVSQIIADKAVDFIESHSGKGKPPFFLYYAANIPHGPITPSNKFKGSSQCGPYGDFIQELDTQIGQIISAVDKANEHRNTLVIFTSDNGGVATAPESRGTVGEPHLTAINAGHQICGPLRGGKWSIYEGGFRVPFIVRWPGKVQGGQTSDNMISLVDIFATLSDFLGVDYGSDHAEDSFSFWSQISDGPEAPAARDHVIVQSPLGVRAIVRDGWKYMRPWEAPDILNDAQREWLAREMSNPENHSQLYHLKADFDETANREKDYPNIVHQLKTELSEAQAQGRTAP